MTANEIKVGDKIVFDNENTKHYIEVKKIVRVKFEDGTKGKIINNKYSYYSPFREPTPLELEIEDFK